MKKVALKAYDGSQHYDYIQQPVYRTHELVVQGDFAVNKDHLTQFESDGKHRCGKFTIIEKITFFLNIS
jgi:hypothetical protein